MVDDRALAGVLSEFALILANDLQTRSILDHLTRRIVEILPVASAGVSLLEPGDQPRYMAASDDRALRLQKLQVEVGDGPCLLAFESGGRVAVADLALEDRFPEFVRAARAEGVASVFTFPLGQGTRYLGALALYRAERGGLDPRDVEAAETLANVATAYVINAHGHEQTRVSSERMRHLANHDALTGLPNRRLLLERLEHAALRARRSHTAAAVLFVDLDRFKLVNDTYGHAAGDSLLAAVAERLVAVVRPGDTLARLYGDEFVLLCEDVRDRADAETLARRVRGAFTEPFRVGSTELAVSASVGIAFAGPGEEVSGRLLTRADGAMYDAKRSLPGGRSDREDTTARAAGDRLEEALARCTAGGPGCDELSLDYQPVVRPDGVVSGVEALVRWSPGPDSRHEHVPATTVVEVAECSGLTDQLGDWVLEEGARQTARWRRLAPDADLRLHVNVTPRQLSGPGFADRVHRILDRTGLPCRALVLEVTEDAFDEGEVRARTVLQDLRPSGVRVALDNFGCGVSSLRHLRGPVDVLKIDRAVWAQQDPAGSGAAILSSLTGLAHAVGLQVVVERVESEQERAMAEAVDADLAQGFYYTGPVTAAAIDDLLAPSVAEPATGRRPRVPVPAQPDRHSR